MSILSENLKLLRKESYLSFEEIVEKIGVTEEKFIEWEEGLSEPDEYTLEIACKVLKMPYEDIRDRNLTLEREEALKEMKSGNTRKNYDWYFGSKTAKLFYIGYIAYFVVGLIIAFWVCRMITPNDDVIRELLEYNVGLTFEQLKFKLLSQNLISCLSVFSGGAGIFIAVWYFKRHTFRFSPWFIFRLGLLLSIAVIISSVACIPFFIYAIIQLIPKRKRM